MGKIRQTGFSLIELMITLVIVGILVQVVAPGFQKMIKDNRVRGEVFALRAALNTARSEALTRRQTVVVCPGTESAGCGDVTSNWADGYIAFTDPDGDNDYTAATTLDDDDLIVSYREETAPYMKVWLASTNGAPRIEFTAQGFTGTTASIEVCDDRAASDARGLTISAVGYVAAAIDDDDDGIRDDHGGNNFDCVAPTAPP